MTKNIVRRDTKLIESLIQTIRRQRVIIDADLAEVYGVPTRRLNEQVKRNRDRFPEDFMFRLTPEEKTEVIANCDHLLKLKFAKALPFAFTEHGAIMAANVLNSPKAIQMSVFVVRAFIRMRQMLSPPHELARKLAELEKKLTARLDGHEAAITEVLQQIMSLLNPSPEPEPPPKRIGFHVKDKLKS